jgi:hypothetical protein
MLGYFVNNSAICRRVQALKGLWLEVNGFLLMSYGQLINAIQLLVFNSLDALRAISRCALCSQYH